MWVCGYAGWGHFYLYTQITKFTRYATINNRSLKALSGLVDVVRMHNLKKGGTTSHARVVSTSLPNVEAGEGCIPDLAQFILSYLSTCDLRHIFERISVNKISGSCICKRFFWS